MPLISEYSSSNDKLRLVLQGPSGQGKTVIACQFPGAWVFDIDVNLGGALRYLQASGLPLPIGYDTLDRDDKGEAVPKLQQFLRLDQKLMDAQRNPAVQTLVLDSGTTLVNILIDEICRQQGKPNIQAFKDGRQFWGFFKPFCMNFFATLAQMRKHVILIVHEKTNKTESGGIVYPIKVAWPGQVGENIGAFFTNVWRAEVQMIQSGATTNRKWYIRTLPTGMYELKSTLAVPELFEFKWDVIQKALGGTV